MTPKPRTTWIVGTLTLAVLVGVVCAGWRPMMERYWAARFADDALSHEERLGAARRLVASESTLFVETAMSVLSESSGNSDNEQATAARRILVEALQQLRESFADVSVAGLKRAFQDGDERERTWAVTLLILFRRFSLEATPELIVSMRSGSEELQEVSAEALMFGLADWQRSESRERSPVEISEFANVFGVKHAELTAALAAVAKSPSLKLRTRVLVILSEHLVPSPELEAMLPPDIAQLIKKRRRSSSQVERLRVEMELQLLHARKGRAGEQCEGLMPLGDVEDMAP